MHLRSFAYGIIVGILIVFGSLALVGYAAGIKWQPVQAQW